MNQYVADGESADEEYDADEREPENFSFNCYFQSKELDC